MTAPVTSVSGSGRHVSRFSWKMTVLKIIYAHEKRSCHEQTTSYGPASLRPDSTKTLSGKPGAVQLGGKVSTVRTMQSGQYLTHQIVDRLIPFGRCGKNFPFGLNVL